MTTLTILCSLCAHDRVQHTPVMQPDGTTLFYCLAFCPCSGSTTFQGKGTLAPSKR